MAKCPNCNRKLHIWNIKAECPDCHANIPNYNWEGRLAEDALIREESFFKLYSKLNKIKFAAIGTPLRIARLALSFLPIVGYVIPLANLTVTTAAGEETALKGISLISLFTSKLNFGELTGMLSNADTKTAGIFGLLSLASLFLSLLLAVIAFFLIPINFKKPASPISAILHALSIPFYALSPFILSKFAAEYAVAGLGTASSSYGWGIIIGAILFVAVFIIDIIVAKTPLGEKDGKYIPTDELQREYAISIGAITEDEMPIVKEKKAKKKA
ncbi:MAG: hypothetical protein NC122_01310 [Faecalibacterium sp.]|nr:hypothetical protein [Ruminococcus sp.]MCM1392680.1 hypothetical protein [Ruminococcus sp.]MCM1484827.1 hypothetical protein [Faecalibacterium sp.]